MEEETEIKPIDLKTGNIKVDETQIWNALKECYDPEIPVNIVDLGLVYEVKIEDNGFIYVKMTLTAPGCGMGPYIVADMRRRILQVENVKEAKVDIVFNPMWNQSMMSEQAKLILNIS